MKTLDRYIVRNFLTSAVLWFVVLMSLRIVTDLFVNIDEFGEKVEETRIVETDGQPVERTIERDKTFAETLRQIGSYYGHQSLVYFAELGGVIIVAAAAFSLARMNHTNELTAMLASGFSLHRVIWPIVLCAMLLGGLIILDQELLIPRVAHRLVRSRDEVSTAGESFRVEMVTDGRNSVWYAHRFDPAAKVMAEPIVVVRDDNFAELVSLSGALARPAERFGREGWDIERAVMARTTRGGDGAWIEVPTHEEVWTHVGPSRLLDIAVAEERRAGRSAPPVEQIPSARNVSARDERYGMRIEADRLLLEPPVEGEPPRLRAGTLIEPRFIFTSDAGRPLGTFVAASATWKPGESADDSGWALTDAKLFYPSDLRSEDLVLRQKSEWLSYMSSAQLGELIRKEEIADTGAARLTRHTRITDPINNLIMLLLALPFIISRERNIKASATLCLLMVLTFYAFVYLCRHVGLPPTWAAWLPILMFGPIAAVMLDTVKT